ncbi:hypothetical protein G3T14_07060 [Methylobacterium sp. BTF04]|uniref:hypothetical protein n=1 Tax=Methylobacterium sp. BTF04 TaxID=2708300 RepID=UPI0013D8234A|nr:hypothetical protein [Methylobacterium sp. BTF04]NEU11888.1 hypothetical protein [Methylobacterium sp. BTF04]
MDGMRVLALTGGVAAFAGAVAAGALIIITLLPGERLGPSGENALLMERATALKPFTSPEAPAPGPVEQRQPAVLSERPAPMPSATRSDEASRLGEGGTYAAVPALTAPPPPKQAAPVQTASREVPHGKAVTASPPVAMPPVAAAPPQLPRLRRPQETRADTVLTAAEIRRIKLSLRLTRDQEPYWFPVEQMLLEIGTQQVALVRAGQAPSDAFGIGAAMRMSSVARPLLDVLREDQKAQVRERARAMGFGSVASSL